MFDKLQKGPVFQTIGWNTADEGEPHPHQPPNVERVALINVVEEEGILCEEGV
jgi:hypothetical protein